MGFGVGDLFHYFFGTGTMKLDVKPDRLIAAADHALYAAKNDGKNRHAVYDPAPPLAPGYDAAFEQALRKHA